MYPPHFSLPVYVHVDIRCTISWTATYLYLPKFLNHKVLGCMVELMLMVFTLSYWVLASTVHMFCINRTLKEMEQQLLLCWEPQCPLYWWSGFLFLEYECEEVLEWHIFAPAALYTIKLAPVGGDVNQTTLSTILDEEMYSIQKLHEGCYISMVISMLRGFFGGSLMKMESCERPK